MKIINISYLCRKATCPIAYPIQIKDGSRFFCVNHGQVSRQGWQLRFPLGIKDFPCNDMDDQIHLDGDYDLLDMRRTDKKDNKQYLIVKGSPSEAQLVFWSMGKDTTWFMTAGQMEIIASAYDTNGVEQPVVMARGPGRLIWRRGCQKFEAYFDGTKWTIVEKEVHNE